MWEDVVGPRSCIDWILANFGHSLTSQGALTIAGLFGTLSVRNRDPNEIDGAAMSTSTSLAVEHLRPKSVAEGVSWIWNEILFSGHPPKHDRLRWGSLLVLLVLPSLLLYTSLSFHLLEPDESRYAEIPREMLERGDWVVPHLQGKPYLDKPPLMYWLVMLSYRMLGVDNWTARLVPGLALHATILSIYWFGRRHLGERAALWGSLLLSVAPGFISMGRLLILDGLLALWTTLGTLMAFEAMRQGNGHRLWWRLSWLATGLGILTKGPVALVLVLVPLVVYFRWLRRQNRPRGRDLAEYVVGSVAVSLPWYVAIGLREPIFLRYFLWEHNVVRFVAPFDHIRPVWFYLPVLLIGMWPATLLFFGFLRSLLLPQSSETTRRPSEVGFYLLAASCIVVFFSLSGSKLPTYILPSFPWWAFVVGWHVSVGGSARRTLATVLVGAMTLILVYAHCIFLPWYATMRSPMGEPEKVIPYCADPTQPVVCFPRSCDSVAFYLRRDDLQNIRSKNFPDLVALLRQNPRTILLCTHRHSLESIRHALPPDIRIIHTVSFRRDVQAGRWFDKLATETPWGLCDLVVIERIP